MGDTPAADGPAEDSPSELLRLIAFSLDGEWYALEVSHVRGIEPETDITPVPRAPAWLLGVFNLHGTILPAIDPRPLLGMPKRDRKDSALLVNFHWDGNQAALMVDSVDEMYEVSHSSLEPQLAAREADRSELIQGQVRVRDRLIGVINPRTLLATLSEG
ncbi:MAG: chemotaxis protein CheW [Chloroflexota bacterium]